MKNLLKKYTGILSLLSFLLILPIHYAHAQNVDKLFGIKLFDNIELETKFEEISNQLIKSME